MGGKDSPFSRTYPVLALLRMDIEELMSQGRSPIPEGRFVGHTGKIRVW
jgi:hypothetical protein